MRHIAMHSLANILNRRNVRVAAVLALTHFSQLYNESLILLESAIDIAGGHELLHFTLGCTKMVLPPHCAPTDRRAAAWPELLGVGELQHGAHTATWFASTLPATLD